MVRRLHPDDIDAIADAVVLRLRERVSDLAPDDDGEPPIDAEIERLRRLAASDLRELRERAKRQGPPKRKRPA